MYYITNVLCLFCIRCFWLKCYCIVIIFLNICHILTLILFTSECCVIFLMNNIVPERFIPKLYNVETININNDKNNSSNNSNSTKETLQRAALRLCILSSVITADYDSLLFKHAMCYVYYHILHTRNVFMFFMMVSLLTEIK